MEEEGGLWVEARDGVSPPWPDGRSRNVGALVSGGPSRCMGPGAQQVLRVWLQGVRPFSVPWTLVRSHLADERTEASEVKGHPWVTQTITGQIQNVHSTCPWVPPVVLRAQARGSVLGLSIKGGPALSPGHVCQA